MISPFRGCGELAKDCAPGSLAVFVELVKIYEAEEVCAALPGAKRRPRLVFRTGEYAAKATPTITPVKPTGYALR
jgi:hypothetical protein